MIIRKSVNNVKDLNFDIERKVFNMNENYNPRRYDTPNRSREFTDRVYSGVSDRPEELRNETYGIEKTFYPAKSEYNIYFGELHGHSCLSDGAPTADEYYINIRDNAGLDFGALTDHDHGGIGNAELFGEKWEYIKTKAKEYYQPGKFTTLLAYERDSYPWYNNLVVYYDSHDGDMLIGDVTGEISRDLLSGALNNDSMLIVPHDTYSLDAGADFDSIDPSMFPPLLEIYSRGDSAEYFGNPLNIRDQLCRGGFWQDALRRGAKTGVIAASDDHAMCNGLVKEDSGIGIKKYPGITGVLAKENTLPAIFEALKARRCYGFMGSGRMYIDFRINGHYMGEEFDCPDTRNVYFKVDSDTPVKEITLVKNCEDYMIIRRSEQMLYDRGTSCDTDIYYLRVELTDGRCGWTSPIWINNR